DYYCQIYDDNTVLF
nr:immunoglobulin light chain junction region [Macaca mulatta]MOV94242.1 immunoglobulin light chain junction region [Macaca mulatta]MOV94347.1 immunoglobulin light chain junction region [Macaca mulatta]MOV94372.1 immunoglobulin light chain junction region [Macaca mulatta]MOV94459.1 immunoglobulin light chain junction region [Macaca mulatta]